MTKHEQCSLSIDGAISLQNTLNKDRIRLHADTSEFVTVAGVDLAYWEKESKEYAVSCVVVLEQESKEIIESQYN